MTILKPVHIAIPVDARTLASILDGLTDMTPFARVVVDPDWEQFVTVEFEAGE